MRPPRADGRTPAGPRRLRATAAAGILGLLLLGVLGALPGAAAAQAPEPICVQCHESVSREVVDTWRSQNHGSNGVGCPVCHNTHEQDFRPQPQAGVCFGCHDVAAVHQGFTPETPGTRCMECHTANVHLLPGPGSWFQGGLPPEDLVAQPEAPPVSAAAGRLAAVVVVLVAAAAGIVIGLVLDRFVREL